MHPRFFARDTPDKAAAINSATGEVLTYATLETIANQGAHYFRSKGVQNGDAVAIWLPNTLRYFEFYWAAQRAGLYIAPVPATLSAAEAAHILNDSDARILLTCGTITGLDALLADPAQAPGLEHMLWTDTPVEGAQSWHEVIAPFPDTPIVDEQAGMHMVYSSGTTGRPKGVKLPATGGPATEESLLAAQQRELYGVGEDTVFLSPAPLYHTAPLAFTTIEHRLGGTAVIMPKFDPEAALAAIERYGVTFSQMVPTMFIRLLRLPAETRARYRLSSLRKITHAAAPCPVDVKRQMIEWLGPIIYEFYGGSEANGSTFITPEEWLRKPGSVGRPNWGSLHICGDDGKELPAGEQGLIYFEGGWDFEYRNDPQKTRDARHPDNPRWSTLGDVGYVDDDGYLFLTDRKNFMIISGGVNIYPQEAENLLATFPGIADVAVIGVPHPDMGEEVKAVVEPMDWSHATPEFAERIIAHCRAHLSHVKCPRSVDFERSLPREDNGKLYKRRIRDRYWADHEKRVR